MNETRYSAIGVLGATGYTGRELMQLLARHPRARIVFATSESEAGTPLRRLARAAPDLALVRAEDAPLGECDVVFSCLPHGESLALGGARRGPRGRGWSTSPATCGCPGPETPAWARGAVYGLPELHRERHPRRGAGGEPGLLPHRRHPRAGPAGCAAG